MKTISKILIVITIVFIIVGIWFFKNKLLKNNSDDEFKLDMTYDFDIEKLKSYGLPIIIDFGSDSCVPCKEMEPILNELNKEYRGKAIVKFVDISKNEDAVKDFPIRVIPTQFFFNADGTPFKPKEDQKSNFTMYSSREDDKHVLTSHEGQLNKNNFEKTLNDMGVN